MNNIQKVIEENKYFRMELPRLLKYIDKTRTCWNWKGTIMKSGGYGQTYFKGKYLKAHKIEHLVDGIIFEKLSAIEAEVDGGKEWTTLVGTGGERYIKLADIQDLLKSAKETIK